LYEELMSPEETRRALELSKYFSVLPAFRGIYHDIQYGYPDLVSATVTNPYVSAEEQPFSVEQIRQLLKDYKLLGTPEEETSARYWPGDKEEKK
jgi:hypothetical protein